MKMKLRILAGAALALGVGVATGLYLYWNQAVPIAAMGINYIRYLGAPGDTCHGSGSARERRQCGAFHFECAAADSDLRRLAELQQNADLGALFCAEPD